MTTLETARSYAESGLSVLPIRADGTKASAVPWKAFQSRIADERELRQFFSNGCGIGIVAGFGDLEIIDIEDGETFTEWFDLVSSHDEALAKSLVIVRTPGKEAAESGNHVYYRCAGVEGNLKLAMYSGEDGRPTTLIETRGSGGYCVAPGSPAKCHIKNKPYVLIQGELTKIPTISAAERSLLLDCARSFNRIRKQKAESSFPAASVAGDRPGDRYNQRTEWREILEPHGWTYVGNHGEEGLWRRPAKAFSFSATTNYKNSDLLYCFSTNGSPFEHETSYTKFYAYALLNHGGDMKAAARCLAERYGMEPQKHTGGAMAPPPVGPVGEHGEDESDDDRPKPSATLKNAVKTILEQDLADIRFDDFLGRPMTGNPAREWTDADDLELNVRMQNLRGFGKIGLDTVRNAALMIAFRNRANCVKAWFDSLRWDRTPRIDHFFEDHFGAVGTVYTRSASKNFWLSMAARIYRPGCQSDHMVVLEGDQGIGKSAALRIIGGDWFTEQHESATGKSFFEVLQGKLVVEISEMDSFNRAEVTKVKQIVTCTSDRFRESYGRHAQDHPRQCVFVGTTNRDDWNRDETGARRFWPIPCHGEIDRDSIRANRDQFFAEAVHRFKQGEPWWTMPIEETLAEQEKRYEGDPWGELIETFVEAKSEVTGLEILTDLLKFEVSNITKREQMRVATCLRVLGWKRKKQRDGMRVVSMWRPE
jgi:hypothetical protein